MKILMISPNFNTVCGRSRIVYNLIKGLKKKGMHCELMTNGGDAIDTLKSNDIKIHIEDINPNSKSTIGFLKARSKLKDFSRRGEFDIVHVHHRYYDVLLSSLNNRNFHSVHTVHSYLPGKRSLGFNSDLIVPVSHFIKNHLTMYHKLNERKISLIQNFIDPADYNTSLIQNKKTSTVNLLTIGRFHSEKDNMTILRAMKLLKDSDCMLSMCGEGEEYQAYQKFINENNINVELISKVMNVSELISRSEICILSSVNESFGLFILESGLFKKPFIGTASGGIIELIKNGKTGFLFQPGNYKNLASIIKEVMSDKAKGNLTGENLHDVVMNNFTAERGTAEYLNSYNGLLNA